MVVAFGAFGHSVKEPNKIDDKTFFSLIFCQLYCFIDMNRIHILSLVSLKENSVQYMGLALCQIMLALYHLI